MLKKTDTVKDAITAMKKTVNPALELEKTLIRIKTDLQDCQHFIDNHEVSVDESNKIFGNTIYTNLGVSITYLNIVITEFHKRIERKGQE